MYPQSARSAPVPSQMSPCSEPELRNRLPMYQRSSVPPPLAVRNPSPPARPGCSVAAGTGQGFRLASSHRTSGRGPGAWVRGKPRAGSASG